MLLGDVAPMHGTPNPFKKLQDIVEKAPIFASSSSGCCPADKAGRLRKYPQNLIRVMPAQGRSQSTVSPFAVFPSNTIEKQIAG